MFGLNSLFTPLFTMLHRQPKTDASTVAELIKDKAPPEAVLRHPNFPESLSAQDDHLLAYLAQPVTLEALVTFISLPDVDSKHPLAEYGQVSQRASLALAQGGLKVTAGLFSAPALAEAFLRLIEANWATHATAQGYFSSICRALFDKTDVQKRMLVSLFENQNNRYLLRLVENMTSANVTLLKQLVSDPDGLSPDRRHMIFSYLVFYFLNGKFEEPGAKQPDPYLFPNVFEFVEFLTLEDIRFEYKRKYVLNLLNENTINSKKHFLELLRLRVMLLTYLVRTEQLTEVAAPGGFLGRMIDHGVRLRSTQLVRDVLGLFVGLSGIKDFAKCVDVQFFMTLGSVYERFPKADILHTAVGRVMANLVDVIARNPDAGLAVINSLSAGVRGLGAQLGGPSGQAKSQTAEGRFTDLSGASAYAFVQQLLAAGPSDPVLKSKTLELRGRLAKACPDTGKSYIEGSTIFSRSEAPTTLRTSNDIMQYINELSDGGGGPNEPFIQISEDAYSSRSSVHSFTRRSQALSQEERDAIRILESLVESQTMDGRSSIGDGEGRGGSRGV